MADETQVAGVGWSREDEQKLRDLYPTSSLEQLAEQLGRSVKAIRSRAKVLKVKRVRDYRVWTEAQIAILMLGYPDAPSNSLAKMLGRTLSQVYGKATKLGFEKSEAYRASPAACRLRRGDQVGRAYRFPKGHVPANKGTRRPGFAPGRMSETQFKKGQRSRNYLPIGTERFDSDGYLRRKIADGKGGFGNPKVWAHVHKLVWEEANGPIPPGHRLWWKDKNHANNSLENLELLSDREHMRRTTIHNLRYPPELKKAIRALGDVRRSITWKKKRAEQNAKEKHDRGSERPPVRDAGSVEGQGRSDGSRTRKGNR